MFYWSKDDTDDMRCPSICLSARSSKSLSLDAALLVGIGRCLGEVFQRSLGVCLDGLASLSPVCGADLSILVLDRKSQLDGRVLNGARILTVNWKALTKRTVSSTERPTGKSLMVICLSADGDEKPFGHAHGRHTSRCPGGQ